MLWYTIRWKWTLILDFPIYFFHMIFSHLMEIKYYFYTGGISPQASFDN